MINLENLHPVELIKLIRESFIGSVTVFSSGSCYQLHKILKSVYPSAEAWQTIDDHVVSWIPECLSYFDINGEVDGKGLVKVDKEEAKRLDGVKYVMKMEVPGPRLIDFCPMQMAIEGQKKMYTNIPCPDEGGGQGTVYMLPQGELKKWVE